MEEFSHPIINLNCRNCGGNLPVPDKNSDYTKCPYCKTIHKLISNNQVEIFLDKVASNFQKIAAEKSIEEDFDNYRHKMNKSFLKEKRKVDYKVNELLKKLYNSVALISALEKLSFYEESHKFLKMVDGMIKLSIVIGVVTFSCMIIFFIMDKDYLTVGYGFADFILAPFMFVFLAHIFIPFFECFLAGRDYPSIYFDLSKKLPRIKFNSEKKRFVYEKHKQVTKEIENILGEHNISIQTYNKELHYISEKYRKADEIITAKFIKKIDALWSASKGTIFPEFIILSDLIKILKLNAGYYKKINIVKNNEESIRFKFPDWEEIEFLPFLDSSVKCGSNNLTIFNNIKETYHYGIMAVMFIFFCGHTTLKNIRKIRDGIGDYCFRDKPPQPLSLSATDIDFICRKKY